MKILNIEARYYNNCNFIYLSYSSVYNIIGFGVIYSSSSSCQGLRSIHNCLGQDHYAHCSQAKVTRVTVSKERCPNSLGLIHCRPTSPVSVLTARFNPRGTVVVDYGLMTSTYLPLLGMMMTQQ